MNDIDQKSAQIVDALADLLLDVVTNGKVVEVEDDEGNKKAVRVTPEAATLNVVRQFVKDFPPMLSPTRSEPRGILKQFEKRLPFEQPKAN